MRGYRQGVHTSRKLLCQGTVNHPVPFEPGLPCEGRCANLNPEMGFPFGSASRVASVLVAFVDDLKLARRKLSLELCGNPSPSLAKLHFAAHGFVN